MSVLLLFGAATLPGRPCSFRQWRIHGLRGTWCRHAQPTCKHSGVRASDWTWDVLQCVPPRVAESQGERVVVSNPGPQPALRAYSLLPSSQLSAEMLRTREGLICLFSVAAPEGLPLAPWVLNEPLWLFVGKKCSKQMLW